MQRITTESGAVYLRDGDRIQRQSADSDHEKRADGDWIRLYNEPNFTVGWRAILELETLAPIGPDDHSTPPQLADPNVTVRITTAVEKIEEI